MQSTISQLKTKISTCKKKFVMVVASSPIFLAVPGRFGPESFRPWLFRPVSFRPWVVSANFGGSFRPDVF